MVAHPLSYERDDIPLGLWERHRWLARRSQYRHWGREV